MTMMWSAFPGLSSMTRAIMTRAILAGVVALGAVALAAPATAQSHGPPNALQGFSKNRDQPVQIEAATLEVREKEKQATFSGNVKVTQGDTGLRAKTLVVFYEDNSGSGDGKDAKKGTGGSMTAATPGPGGQQQIKRLEARGGVVVTQKDQTVTGDTGVFDMRTNTVTMNGNVVMTQGPNVMRGDRLVVDLGSGVSRVESGRSGNGRVQGLFQAGGSRPGAQGHGQNQGAMPSIPALPAPGSRQPMRLN
jgi:lipopolysaccharide export system protein LptA